MGKEKIKSFKSNVRINKMRKANVDYMSEDLIKGVRNFHRTFPQYASTPLDKLSNLSNFLGVKEIFVKDESYRFGLNAFKVLGASFAMGKILGEKLQMDISDLSFNYLRSKEVKDKLGQLTFVTATDGNHGRAVAWAARELGQKSVVYMPKGSSKARLENIRREGAQAEIIDGNYDEAVRLSEEKSKEHGWIVVQDTAWDGYEEIPRWIMQGYGTIIDEALEQMKEYGDQKPTHIFLQAGVGSFAGAILGYLISRFGNHRPITAIVEAQAADCLYKSAIKGHIEKVQGHMSTIMAGLACGEPNRISWEIIRDYTDIYLSCPDYVSARAMRILAAPLKGDTQIISGESGSVGLGVLSLAMERQEYKDLKEDLVLDKNSVVLIISTEGDTDPKKYKEIVWDGEYNSK